MNTVTLLVQLLVALGFLWRAAGKLFGFERSRASFEAMRLGRSWRWGLGVLELFGGLGMLASMAQPFLVFFVCVLLAALSIGMLATQFLRKSTKGTAMVGLLLAGTVAAAALQPLGLKVLALPKAADLPDEAAPARVVKTYEEGLWFEGIAAGADGTLYLSANRNLDFALSDYYRHAHGEVLVRRPDGVENVLFQTPPGSTAGVVAVASDGSLYMTSHSRAPCIWHIKLDGQAAKVAELPSGAWPNGLDIGPDGNLYAPDSALGVVWRIDPAAKAAERVIESAALKARAFISLAPGANGLHFSGRDMYVTVSDRTTVLKFTLDAAGRFGEPTVMATGIPGDDFAIGPDGSLFIATHPYNTLVRVMPDGRRIVVGNAAQHIVGATAAVFGRRPDDRDTLYVVTDGGAFTGGPKTRGELVALRPYEQHQ
ncbi:MAG: DoxX family protein [Burkholderiales bacterium]|nr:DoxX family protein [Burkholderiales bacterium]